MVSLPGRAREPWALLPLPLLLLLLLLLGTVALYAPFVDHPFLFDDAVQIGENPAVTAGAPVASYLFDRNTTSSRPDYNTRIYRPLRNLGFRAIAAATGPISVAGATTAPLRPLPFGVANLALYLVCVALVFATACTFAGARAALLATALFAAAPVHVEAVLYASALGDLLSAAFEMMALLMAVSAVSAHRRRGRGRGRARAAGLAAASLVCAALALAAKEMAVTGVAVLAMWLWARGTLWNRRGVALVGAHGALVAGYLSLRTSVLGQIGQEAVTARTLAAGLREAPWLLVHYAHLAVLPIGHAAAYVVAPPSPLQLALALALIAGTAVLAWRAHDVALRVGLGWFAVSLLPVLHLVPLWADLADRFAFVPSVGLAVAAAGMIDRLDGRAGKPAGKPGRSRPVFIGAAMVLALYVVGSALEARSWSSDGALWSHAAEMAPDSSLAQANLGVVRLTEGRPDQALVALDRAVALGRDGADVSYRRATALAALGRLSEARAAALHALDQGRDRDQDRDPRRESGRTYALLADVEGRLGDRAAAGSALSRAQALQPDHPSTLLAQAGLAERDGRAADAAAIYVGLAARYPREARFRLLAARAFISTGDRARAADQARACLAVTPEQAQCQQLLLSPPPSQSPSPDSAQP